LQTAAVLGREFSPRLLAAIWEGTDSLAPLSLELQRLEFLFEHTGVDELSAVHRTMTICAEKPV
jgi:hypothetical protein